MEWLSKLLPIIEKLGDYLMKMLLAFFSYQAGKKDVINESNEKELEDVKESQEIRANISALSDADLDNGLRSKSSDKQV